MFKTKYRIKVNYKSGLYHIFWVYSFTMENGNYSWEPTSDGSKPMMLGVDNIESVYQVGYKRWGIL